MTFFSIQTFFFKLDIALPGLLADPVHHDLTKGPLTKNIGARFPDVRDEITVAFDEYIPVKGDGYSIYNCIGNCGQDEQQNVRWPSFVADWIELNKEYTVDIDKTAIFLGLLPPVLRPIVSPLLRGIPKGTKRATRHVEPLIQERLEQEAQHGKGWPEKPNDLITWMLDDKPRSLKALAIALLGINFASIHTTTIAFTFVLFELATKAGQLHQRVFARVQF
ncbi:hypothetical protein M378DRAFT_913775 [Amanita muscaria Koide BX008]|uniref:Uncharacterized protein n=1 Tax=Amanita muscaria (strain Koide BX008) TaxID=946122 RepID=A0A0C2SCD1_AMAMK|nr:hypothetical protein M378DRAFT_913775 [Amanita muscaria Koide BX008]